MFLIVHATAGAVIGDAVAQSGFAFSLGFLSHFILDIIPHGDEVVGRLFIKTRRYGWLSFVAVLDCLTAFSFVSLLWLAGLFPQAIAAFAGALGAVIPDVLAGLSELSRRKLWPDFVKLHNWNHQLIKVEVSFWVGGLGQLLVLLLLCLWQAGVI